MSKNSPGVCINHNGELFFKSFYRGNPSRKERKNFDLFENSSNLAVHYNKNKRPAKMEYETQERWNILDAIYCATNILENLPLEADYIGLEGFSYGSKGNAGLDIAGYAYVLRQKLVERYGAEKLYIFSPAEIKKNAGKGNAGKELMLEYFVNVKDESNKLREYIIDGSIDPNEKPIDDIIDAYWIQELLKTKVK